MATLNGRGPDQGVRRPHGRAGRQPRRRVGRGRRAARTERRRQDHDLLDGRRAGRPGLGTRARSTARTSPTRRCTSGPRKGIGYLPQEASIFRGLTVEQNIAAILETLDLDAAGRRARLRELLAELDLTRAGQVARPTPCRAASGAGSRSPGRWSSPPKFMLLDEPFAGIDPIAVSDIQKIIFHLKTARDRRAHHRPQRPGNTAHHRSRLHRPRRRDIQEWNAAKPRRRRGSEEDLPRR